MNSLYLDLILLGFGAFILFSGWRRGLIVSTLSFIGLILGAWLSKSIIDLFTGSATTTSLTSTSISVTTFFICMGIGSALGAFVGNRIRKVFSWAPVRFLDNITGAAISLVAWSVVAWFMATTMLAAPVSSVTNVISESRVIMALEQEMPDQIRGGFEFVRVYISESGLPDGLADVLLAPAVSAPDETAIDAPDVLAALDSVVKVEGNANACNTRLTGSGFVVGPDLIITNAHVVAGVTSPTVRVKGKGKAFEGTIVYFDPNKDVALIRVDDFPSVQLDISEPLEREASAVAAGFPGGGPLELIPARIRGISLSTGTNIYGEGEVTREIYAIAADIKQGDSGAPLFALDGSVAGLVFASSATDSQTGYALTAKEFMVGVEAAKSATKAVDTGDCSSV